MNMGRERGLLFQLRAFNAILSELSEELKCSQSVVRTYKVPANIITS
jgi:hypothetical protein